MSRVVSIPNPYRSLAQILSRASNNTFPQPRYLTTTARMDAKFKPAKRVAGQKPDVWSIVNEAAAASPKQPIGRLLQVNTDQLVLTVEQSTWDRASCECSLRPIACSGAVLMRVQRLQPTQIHPRRSERRSRPSRMQSILTHKRPAAVKEGSRRCILPVLWQEA